MARRGLRSEAALIVCIILVAFVFIGYMAATTVTRGKAQSELDRIRAMGEPTCAADLVPDPIPDEANAAVVYQKAFALMDSPSYTADSSIFDDLIKEDRRQANPKLWDDALGALRRNGLVFETVSQAAKRPECQFSVDWEAGADTKFTHLPKLRNVIRLEAAAALVYAQRGDVEHCVDAVDTGLRVSQAVRDEPHTICYLVMTTMLETMTEALRDSLELCAITESNARRLDSTLSTTDLQDAYAQALIGERAMAMWAYDEVKQWGPQSLGSLSAAGPVEKVSRFLVTRSAGRPLLEADRAHYLRYMTEQIELARQPYHEVADKISQFDPSAELPAYAPIVRIILPIYGRARVVGEKCRATVAVTRVGLGLLAYRDRYGQYPETLEELARKLNWDLPKDPFDGKHLKYSRTVDGFVLYSIGANMVDEGGREPGPKDPDTGDVVWRMRG